LPSASSVVYEACGFGFGLYRQLLAIGAHCYVIAPRKLDEQCIGVKTDPRDALTLCRRLSRYVEGNTRELPVIRVPSEEEERARHTSRQREQLVHHRQKLEAQGLHRRATGIQSMKEMIPPPRASLGSGGTIPTF
jgi:transposase